MICLVARRLISVVGALTTAVELNVTWSGCSSQLLLPTIRSSEQTSRHHAQNSPAEERRTNQDVMVRQNRSASSGAVERPGDRRERALAFTRVPYLLRYVRVGRAIRARVTEDIADFLRLGNDDVRVI